MLADHNDASLKLLTLGGNLINIIKPLNNRNQPIMKAPWSIAINSLNHVYIYDFLLKTIFIFEGYYFDLIDKIEFIHDATFMACDTEMPSYLYTIDSHQMMLNLFDSNTKMKLRDADLFKPWDMKLNKDKIFIISLAQWHYENSENTKISTIDFGNFIYVIDKLTFEKIQIIKCDEWLGPRGLHIDSENNLWTLAFKLNENRIKSKYRYLFMIDQSGMIVNKAYCERIDQFNDFVATDKILLFIEKLHPTKLFVINYA